MGPLGAQGPLADRFGLDTLDVAAGLPQASVVAVAQDLDGYLYLGTFGGLARFDGHRAVVLGPDEGVDAVRVTALAIDPGSGDLWIGSQYGAVSRWSPGGGAVRVELPEPSRATVWDFALEGPAAAIATSAGVWTDRAGTWTLQPVPDARAIARAEGGTWSASHAGLTGPDGHVAIAGPVFDAAVDVRGGVWWVGPAAVGRVGGPAQALPPSPDPARVLVDRAERVWVGRGRELWLLGAASAVGTDRAEEPTVFPLGGPVRVLFEDRAGAVWVGTDGGGVTRVTERPWTRLGAGGVSFVDASVEPVWWGSGCRVQGPGAPVETGVRGCVSSVLRTPTGVWVGSFDGELGRDGAPVADLPAGVLALAADPAAPGEVLVGTEGAGLWRATADGVSPVPGLEGAVIDVVAVAPDGAWWAGLLDGVAVVRRGLIRRLGPADGLPDAQVRAIGFAPDGSAWLGTYGGGLAHVGRDGAVLRLGTSAGLRELVVSSLVSDGAGALWANGNRGVSRLWISELESVVAGRSATVQVHLLATGEGNGGAMPAGGRAPDGTLWFPTIDGVVRFDPARVAGVDDGPYPVIEAVRLRDGARVSRPEAVVAPGGGVELSFTAPVPDGRPVGFRYRVLPDDRAWRDVGSVRSLALDLPPGRHTIELGARGASGVWSRAVAAVRVDVPRAWSESPWVRFVAPWAAASLVIAGMIWRLRVNRARAEALEREVAERIRLAEEFRRSEAHHRALFAGSSDPLLLVAPTGEVVDANAAAAAMYGGTVEDLVGLRAATLFDGELFVSRDGASTPVRVRSAKVGDRELLTVVDLSGLLDVQRQLVASERADAVGRVAGGLAHEFNNLLTVVRTNAAELRRTLSLPRTQLEAFEHIEEAAARGGELLRQLLAVGRRQLLQPEVVDLAQLLRRLEPRLRRTVPQGQRLVLAPEAGCRVSVDPPQLERVLLALIAQAAQRARADGRITVDVARRPPSWVEARWGWSPPDDVVVTSVADDGVALTPTVTARLFEPFADLPERPGGPLGLAAVQGFVEQSAGHLYVRSQAGQGTVVDIVLPCAEGAARATPAPAPELLRRLRILVVDDENLVRRALVRMLENLGHQVRGADGGASALAAMADEVPQVLVTDVLMPGMTGPELVAEARRRFPGVAVVYVTAYAQEHADRLDAPVVAKPFERAELEAALRRALTSWR
jgi:signal transduction histidine kinase/ligand-binding sensor domain-containing protein